MPRRLLSAALATLLATPAAFGASPVNLTIYSTNDDALFSGGGQGPLAAGHALVNETRALTLATGNHEVRIGDLPATVDPEAIAVGFDARSGVTVLGQRVLLPRASAIGSLEGALGREVEVLTSGAASGEIRGTLIGASAYGLLLRDAEGRVQLVHRYSSMTLPPDAAASGSTLLLDVAATSAGQRDAALTYVTAGLGWRAAYTATLEGGTDACRMRFQPVASVANRSGRDYADSSLRLIAGQPNLGNARPRVFMAARAATPMAAALPKQATVGDYRSFTLPGSVNLPDGSVTLTPLYPSQALACAREYVVSDGGGGFPPKPNTSDYGAQEYRDRPIASALAFDAPEALPAGNLRAWTDSADGVPTLLGEGGVADTPKGQRVAVPLGESFDLRASRERTAFHVDADAHRMRESYRITLANGGDASRTVTVREHPDRWREWTVPESSSKPVHVTPQLLEFRIAVPAKGEATLTYTVQYQWGPQDQ